MNNPILHSNTDRPEPPGIGEEETVWPSPPGLIASLMETRRSRLTVGALCLLLIPIILWQSGVWAHTTAVRSLKKEGDQRLVIYRSALQSEFEKYEFHPVLLARVDDFVRLLITPEDKRQREWINSRLDEFNSIAKTSATYLMDRNGLTLASSNWKSETSFVGKNFSFRPYFIEAMKGRSGRYFALGTTSNEPGYYLSHPVQAAGETLGVIVVKVGVQRLEEDWAASKDKVMVSDQDGIIFMSSNPAWKYKTLAPLSQERREAVRKTRKYSNQPLSSLPQIFREPYEEGAEVLTLGESTLNKSETVAAAKNYFFQTMAVPNSDWKLHLLSDMSSVRRTVAYAVLITSFAIVIAIMVALNWVQRRLALRERLLLQRQAQRALRRANDQLETRVHDRTADLKASNKRLKEEISERRKAEADLRQAQDELIQASKLAALGQLAAGINHEMNQPLTAIRSYSDNARVLLERERTDDVRSNLEQISELTARISEIAKQLKVFSRKADDGMEAVELSQVVSDALTLLGTGGKLTDIEIVNRINKADFLAKANLVRLEQVFLNLFGNARDAMQDSTSKRLEIDAEADDLWIRILVRDTGSGFAKGQVEKIFDPFYTTKEVGRGLGLGLSISYRIIEDFGGKLRAANHPDGGAVFQVELKRAKQPPMAQAGE